MPQTQIKTLPLRARPGFVARLVNFLIVATTRRRERSRLGLLDARLLRDIGLDASAAHAECDKPFWRS